MEKRAYFNKNFFPAVIILPQLIITAVFFIWPAFNALYQSLFIEDPFGLSTEFSGLANFTELFSDEYYVNTFVRTLVFSFSVCLLSMGLALLLASSILKINIGKNVFFSMIITPYAIAPALSGVLWLFMMHPSIGNITGFLKLFGYEWNHYSNSVEAFILVVVASSIKQISYNFVFFYAAMQSIPKSLIEAAAMDGAGSVKRFWTIIFPLISPTTFFLLILNIVYAYFDTFGIIHAVTDGGPSGKTEILVFKVFKDGFVGLNIGSSAAQSVILLVLISVLTLIQFKFVEKKVKY